MCGIDYCGACEEHARTHGIEDWAQGLTHERPPVFGDTAQRRTAERRRQANWEHALRERPYDAMHWPEFPRKVMSMIQGQRGPDFKKRAVFEAIQAAAAERDIVIRVRGDSNVGRVRAKAVRGAIAHFPHQMAAVIFCYVYKQYQYHDVAAAIGISGATPTSLPLAA